MHYIVGAHPAQWFPITDVLLFDNCGNTFDPGYNFHTFLTGKERVTFIGGYDFIGEDTNCQLPKFCGTFYDFDVTTMDHIGAHTHKYFFV